MFSMMGWEVPLNQSSNQRWVPDNLEEFKYCYGRDRSQVVWILLAGLCLGYISYLLTRGDHSEAIFLWGLTAFVICRAIWVICDNGVKFCFNEEGLLSGQNWIPSSDIDSYQVVERQDGVQLRYILEFTLNDGRLERIELSGLDKPVEEILRDLSQQFEAPCEEEG